MATTMQLEIVRAEAEIFRPRHHDLLAPAVMGEVGIMPRHTPLITKIKPGEVHPHSPKATKNTVSAACRKCNCHRHHPRRHRARAKDIDEAAAIVAKQRAEQARRSKR